MEIRNQVRKFRENEGITQAELAKEMDVSRQTINAIETGKYDPSLELALKLSNFFDTGVKEMFSLEE